MLGELMPCGTYAAARRHQRRGEPVCEACKEAVRAHNAKQRARRREAAVRRVHEQQDQKPAGGQLDAEAELRAQYDLLGRHLLEAPPQSVAAISRERRAILEALTSMGQATAKVPARGDRGVFDELAQRRKRRGATA